MRYTDRLVEYLADLGLQCACRIEIGAERFFDDDPRPAGLVGAGSEPGFIEHVDDLAEQRRRRGKVEEAIPARSEFGVVIFELAAQLFERRRVVERTVDEREALREIAPERVFRLAGTRELVDRLAHLGLECGTVPRAA